MKRHKYYHDSVDLNPNIDDLIDKSDHLVFYKKSNYISSCINLNLQNGGSFIMDNKEYFSMNTCSIDYFLIIIFIIRMNHMEQFNQLKNIEIGNVFEKIYGHLSCNDWQMARLAWLEFCPGLKQTIKNNNVYDWFLSEYEAYFVYYRCNQFYSWTSKCDNIRVPLCVNAHEKNKNSYTYLLR